MVVGICQKTGITSVAMIYSIEFINFERIFFGYGWIYKVLYFLILCRILWHG